MMCETEEEFLRRYDPTKYRHPSVAVDCVVMREDEILLVRRGRHPFKGKLALPGGFIEEGESAEQAAMRELLEETGIRAERLRQFGFASQPNRDPRDWNISLVFTAYSAQGIPRGGDDAADAKFVKVTLDGNILTVGGKKVVLDVAIGDSGDLDFDRTKIALNDVLAFDHAKIIAAVLLKQPKTI